MDTLTERLGSEQFRKAFGQSKPYYELLDGEPVQKTLPTKLHSTLQFVLAILLRELGFKARPELTLAIDQSWEPVPDVCGILGSEQDPYPTSAVAVAIEILSPDDRLTRVIQKCQKYAEWGIADILVFDPIGREAWYWNITSGNLSRIEAGFKFQSLAATFILDDVFRRLDDELR